MTFWPFVAIAAISGFAALLHEVSARQDNECAQNCVCEVEVVVSEYGTGQGMRANCSNAKIKYFPSPLPVGTTTLILTGNKFSRLWAASFSGLMHLNSLHLDKNRIKKIRRNYFGQLPALQAMYLQQNEIEEIFHGAFRNTSNLRILNLNSNRLKVIPYAQFDGVRYLKNLDLSSNVLETLEDGAFIGLSRLEVLDLSRNRLTTIDRHAFADVYSLKELYLYRNKIVAIDGGAFGRLSMLKTLSLFGNLIPALPQRFMEGLENLEELYIHRNRITHIQPWTFSKSRKLRIMYLYSNMLTSIQKHMFSDLVHLRLLQLAFNSIEYIADDAFRDLFSLTTLYLDANKLSVITARTFTGLGNVKDMNLYFNSISFLAKGAFDPLPRLTRLVFDTPKAFLQSQHEFENMGNRLICNCNVRWLKGWLLETGISNATCYAPPRLNGKSVIQLKESDFTCNPPKVKIDRRTILIASGEDVSMRCVTEVGATFSWSRNGTGFVEDQYHFTTPLGDLNIIAASEEDTGDYTCIARNEAGFVGAALTLSIGERPSFILYPEDVDVSEPLRPAVFNCRADGNPKPQIKWYKEGLLIQSPASNERSQFHITTDGALVFKGKRYHVTNKGSLIIFDPVSEDEGSFECVAENGLGRVAHKVSLYIDLSSKCKQGCSKGGLCLPISYDCICSEGFHKEDSQCKKDKSDNGSGSGASGSASGDENSASGQESGDDSTTGETDDGDFTTIEPVTDPMASPPASVPSSASVSPTVNLQ